MNFNIQRIPEQLEGLVLNGNDIKVVESKVIGSGEYNGVFFDFDH